MENFLELSDVPPYVINSAQVAFFNERATKNSGKAVQHLCEVCGRSLLDDCHFFFIGLQGNVNLS
ncbi:hypothetical protein LINGRAHAP2_LOCUS31860 [Linum grandiflorum]